MDNRSLCLRYLMGDATSEEIATLSEWIAESPENAQAFALISAQDAYMATAVANRCKPEPQDAMLLEELAALEQAAGPVQPVDRTVEVMAQQRLAKQQELDARRMSSQENEQKSDFQRLVIIVPKAAVWIGLAAVVALAATLLFYTTEPADAPVDVATLPGTEPTNPVVLPTFAALVRSLDARWEVGGDQSGYLNEGSHTLSEGLVELELLSGTRVVIEAPASVVLTGINTMDVLSGKAVVSVPKSGRGFILDTPSARFVETGSQSRNDQALLHTGRRMVYASTSTRDIINTEFGVHVDGEQQTRAQVYRGEVHVTATVDREAIGEPVVLGEAQSITVAADSSPVFIAYDELAFKRVITARLNLADLVMGGDGTTQREDIGLHPLTGQYTRKVAGNQSLVGLISTGRLQPTPESPYVAGVFIPSEEGQLNGLPLGLTLPKLPETNGIGYGVIWSGASMPSLSPNSDASIPAKLPGYNFAGAGQPAMIMHTNAGLIIDLNAIRQQNPGFELVAFHGVVGNASGRVVDEAATAFHSEFLIYLDSELAMHNTFVRSAPDEERIASIDLTLHESDRYLTLASTDGGDGNHQDWIVLGDPVVVLKPIENHIPDF